ncbi:hypothetical protein DsansV1_C22g0173431 [Dioscorea sansibarensis]
MLRIIFRVEEFFWTKEVGGTHKTFETDKHHYLMLCFRIRSNTDQVKTSTVNCGKQCEKGQTFLRHYSENNITMRKHLQINRSAISRVGEGKPLYISPFTNSAF